MLLKKQEIKMSEQNNRVPELLTKLEKLYFFSKVTEKERPPISPVPTETRELARRSFEDFMKRVEKLKRKQKRQMTLLI
jgi:hypothetical protein